MNTDKIYAEKIAEEYTPKETSKAVALKKLDAKAKRPAIVFAYSFGIVAALILGVGMCMCMGQLGDGSTLFLVLGIVIGVLGIAGVCLNYPVYLSLLKKGKAQYGPAIVELARQIENEGKENK